MQTLKLLDPDSVAFAYSFLRDAEDEDPVGYGVNELPAFPVRRGGVFREFYTATEVRASFVEDELDVLTDEVLDDEGALDDADASLAEALCEITTAANDNDDDDAPEGWRSQIAAEPDVLDDPTDLLVTSLGIGRAAALARR